MISEQEFRILAGESYQVDTKETEHPWKKGDIIENNNLTQPYQVIKVEDNPSNGMQAMAVAPVKEGKADTSEVVIAYAGTNFDDTLDIHTDVQTVVLGNKDFIVDEFQRYGIMPVPTSTEDSQIITAEKFVEKVKTDYPGAEVTTTGHSLGEYLALYVSAENTWGNVGFNGPDLHDTSPFMITPQNLIIPQVVINNCTNLTTPELIS